MKNNRLNRANALIYPAEPNGARRASKYNNTVMKASTIKAKEGFGPRLTQLRQAKNISAREMSLSIGQGRGYINNIENGHNLPSMAMFFEICEYLEISPAEFFGYTAEESLSKPLEGLDEDEIEIINRLIEKLKK